MVIRALAAALAVAAARHPLHTTFTEVVEDPASYTVTITVRSFTDDLAHAVGAPPPPSGTPTALPDSALARYVRAHFSITSRGGRPMPLQYASQRQSADLSWVTLTIAMPEGLSGATISDRLQTELYPDQVNLLQASYHDRKATLLFSPGDAPRTLP